MLSTLVKNWETAKKWGIVTLKIGRSIKSVAKEESYIEKFCICRYWKFAFSCQLICLLSKTQRMPKNHVVQKNLKFYQRRANFVILKLICKLGTYILINLNWLNKFTTGTGTGTYCLCWGIIFLKRCPKFGIFYHKGLNKVL